MPDSSVHFEHLFYKCKAPAVALNLAKHAEERNHIIHFKRCSSTLDTPAALQTHLPICDVQDKTLRLERILAERDSRIEQLTSQLKATKSMSALPSAPNLDDTGKDTGHREEEARCQVAPAFDGMSDLKLEFQGQIMKLQQYIEANNLRNADPSGESWYQATWAT